MTRKTRDPRAVAAAIALFSPTFSLRRQRGVFQICPIRSYFDGSLSVEGPDGQHRGAACERVQLVVQRQLAEPLGEHAAGDFVDFSRCTVDELRAQIT